MFDRIRKRFERKPNNILVIGDTQFPYEHDDYLAFCLAVEKKFKCGRVIHAGDLADFYNWSRYTKSPDADSAEQELIKLRETVRQWKKAFPKMEITIGNHDRRIINHTRNEAGLPSLIIDDMELLDRAMQHGKGWTWHEKILEATANGNVVFIHGDETGVGAAGTAVRKMGYSVVHGHAHSSCFVWYRSTPFELQFHMNVGCGIDDDKIPFWYNKKQLGRPILSCGVVIDGVPYTVPMRLDKNKRWTGEV